MKTNFELYLDKIGEWRWRAKRSGRIVADGGEGYKKKAGALRSLQRFCNSVRNTSTISLTEVKKCHGCKGTGWIREGGTFSPHLKCSVCKGSGISAVEEHRVVLA